MNVEAAAKGLVKGPLTIMLKNKSVITCSTNEYLISRVDEYEQLTLQLCSAVIVIEKEAVFHSLVEVDQGASRYLVVTGKGCKISLDVNTHY